MNGLSQNREETVACVQEAVGPENWRKDPNELSGGSQQNVSGVPSSAHSLAHGVPGPFPRRLRF